MNERTTVMADQSNQKIDFEKITTKQPTDLNEKCLNNDYKGNDCQQLNQYQKEQREKGQKLLNNYLSIHIKSQI